MTGGAKPLPHEGLAGPVRVVCDIFPGAAAHRFVLAIPFAGAPPIASLMTEVARRCHIADVTYDRQCTLGLPSAAVYCSVRVPGL